MGSFSEIGNAPKSYVNVQPVENITIAARKKYWIAVQLDDNFASSTKK